MSSENPEKTVEILIKSHVSGMADLDWFHDARKALNKNLPVVIDFRQNQYFSPLHISHLYHLQQLALRKPDSLTFEAIPETIEIKISELEKNQESVLMAPDHHASIFEYLGDRLDFHWQQFISFVVLSADAFYLSWQGFYKKKARPPGSVANEIISIGINAFPIVVLLVFLVGLVIALQSAAQLQRFGANIFVTDLIVISMAREMGPLITAIILAGRSGASIAAEIATMKVGEELDALKTMGINPISYVVVPKIYAILITLPILTLFADLVGIFGGMVVAAVSLDIGFITFINRAVLIADSWDFITGLIRSFVFAWQIIIIASWFGMNASGGAQGVGKATTSSVVTSIFMIIVADSVLGLLFYL